MPSPDRTRATRTALVPVLAYLLITLALPAVNGAAARPGFAHHAAHVLAACLTVLAAAFVLDLVRHRRSPR